MNYTLMFWVDGVLLIWWFGLVIAFVKKLKSEKNYEK
jgi:hypothetical protein